MAVEAAMEKASAQAGEQVQRHAAVDRAFHWVTAVCVFVLLATGLLPVVGVRFNWVPIHWITGTVLILAVLFHIVRSLFWQSLRSMVIRPQDFREITGSAKPGKYSLAQKLMHHALGLAVLTTVVTGIFMLAKVDTPFVERDPYILSPSTWGIIYVLHGAAALLIVTLVMIHVYFGLLPEKRLYLRSMVRGWITREELREHHDAERWPGREG